MIHFDVRRQMKNKSPHHLRSPLPSEATLLEHLINERPVPLAAKSDLRATTPIFDYLSPIDFREWDEIFSRTLERSLEHLDGVTHELLDSIFVRSWSLQVKKIQERRLADAEIFLKNVLLRGRGRTSASLFSRVSVASQDKAADQSLVLTKKDITISGLMTSGTYYLDDYSLDASQQMLASRELNVSTKDATSLTYISVPSNKWQGMTHAIVDLVLHPTIKKVGWRTKQGLVEFDHLSKMPVLLPKDQNLILEVKASGNLIHYIGLRNFILLQINGDGELTHTTSWISFPDASTGENYLFSSLSIEMVGSNTENIKAEYQVEGKEWRPITGQDQFIGQSFQISREGRMQVPERSSASHGYLDLGESIGIEDLGSQTKDSFLLLEDSLVFKNVKKDSWKKERTGYSSWAWTQQEVTINFGPSVVFVNKQKIRESFTFYPGQVYHLFIPEKFWTPLSERSPLGGFAPRYLLKNFIGATEKLSFCPFELMIVESREAQKRKESPPLNWSLDQNRLVVPVSKGEDWSQTIQFFGRKVSKLQRASTIRFRFTMRGTPFPTLDHFLLWVT